MENDNKYNHIDIFVNKYAKEEFDIIISLLPPSKLIEPIKKNSNEFSKEIKGFRPNRLPIEKIHDIYNNRIYKNKDIRMLNTLESLIYEYHKEIDEKISEKIDLPEKVWNNIKKNNMKCFEKLINLLIETKYKDNVVLYFKIIDYELSEKQINYLSKCDLKRRVMFMEIECKVKNDLTAKYEKKAKEDEKNRNFILAGKNQEIKMLEEKIADDKNYYGFELKSQSLKFQQSKEIDIDMQQKLLRETEKYENEINDFKLLSNNLKKLNCQKDNEIISLADLIELKYNEYDKIANEKWNVINKNLLQDKTNIEESIGDLRIKKEKVIEEINSLNSTKCDLENKMTYIETKAGGFMNNMQEVLYAIGFKQVNTKPDIKEESSIYKIESKVLEIEKIEIDKRTYFIDDLTMNLEVCGIDGEYAFDLAQYIYATFANKMSLLLVGYNTRKIADAISYIINSESCELITLPLGYNNCNELILTVNTSSSRVVIIENAVDNISESVYIPLIKQNTDKLLIFSMESTENINLLPKSILNYMMMVDIDILLNYESNSELQSGVVNQDIFNVDIDGSSKSSNLRHIKGLDNVIELNNASKLRIAEIMSIIDNLDSQNSMYDILLFSINMLCKCSNKIEGLKKFVEKQEFSPVISKMLQAVLGDVFIDE